MSKIDDDVVTHNLDAIEKGDVIEADLGGDNPAHGVFEVDSVEMIGDTHAKIKVIPIRTAGNWSDQNRTSDVDSWSMSFMLGLEVEASNYYSKTETDNLFTSKTDFDDHEKRNVASFVVVEAELLKVANEVVLNYNDIKTNQDAITDNEDRITQLEKESNGSEDKPGDIKGTQTWVNGTWDISDNVDASVKQCKVHTDKTALVLNKDLIENNDNNWENMLAPYPSELGLELDGTVYGLVIEYQGRAGQNGRGHNFRILSHNLPENVANQTIVGIYPDFKLGIDSKFITAVESKADDKILQDQIDAIDIPEVDVSDKASISQDNTFNGKQVFNKNLTFKGAETALIPTLSSRWHKFSVNPPKNADGTNNTDEAYGVNYWLDAGNTWKNQFRISNRNGVAFEVRGGSDLNGQLHSQWTYSGPQTDDNNIATVKYVKDAVEGINIPDVDLTGYATEDYVQEEINKIDIPETDLSDYMTEDETVEFVDTMDKLTLANAKLDAAEQDRNYAVPLAGNSTKTGKLVLKTNEGTPFEIQSGNGTPIFKMWSSGAVSMLKNYSEFKDNELVTKSYVDNGTVAISGAQTRTSGILTLQESSGKVFQVKKDNDITAELWADGTFITTRTDFSNNHLVSKAYVDDKVGSGGGSGFTQGDRVCATSAGATDVGGFYIENGNLYCKVN